MGFLDLFRRRTRQAPPMPPTLSVSSAQLPVFLPSRGRQQIGQPGQGFAVIDVETTGLSPKGHRVLELAIVRTDPTGRVVDEWVRRFDPEGPVGATHIHGITAADVAGAPRFAEVLPEVTRRLAGAAIAGHNVRFDLGFLRAEYARAGWALPFLPSACTLEHSWDHLPHLDRRRLPDCCAATGIRHADAHSALGDARATAMLLATFLDPRTGLPPSPELLALPQRAWSVTWPTAPGGVRPPAQRAPHVQRRIDASRAKAPAQPLIALLRNASLADALDDGAPDGSLPYLELLAGVLEDGVVTDDERAALRDLAGLYELDAAALAAAHRGFLLALSHLALDDGKVSRAEKTELTATAELLDVPVGELTTVLDAAEAARLTRLSAGLKPLPSDWHLGDPLRVGDKVVFTGCDDHQRQRLEQRAEELGVRVMTTVSRRTALLVTDGRSAGGKAESAERLGTRRVHPDDFAVLLDHLQPASRPPHPVEQPRPEPVPSPSRTTTPPAAIRAWAQANGWEVGNRGRLPAEVVDAYRRAHEVAAGQ